MIEIIYIDIFAFLNFSDFERKKVHGFFIGPLKYQKITNFLKILKNTIQESCPKKIPLKRLTDLECGDIVVF